MLFRSEKIKLPAFFLHEKYIVPPFSVINTHQQYWRDRLSKWRDLGLYIANGRTAGKAYDNRRMDKNKPTEREHNGTSSFNPVLCEVIYKWFMPKEGNVIFDPFAGGIVRGGVAAALGKEYYGFDISQEQVDSNYQEWNKLCEKYVFDGSTAWFKNDSTADNFSKQADLIFTCPPYYNLEQYTDCENDLSNAESYEDFLEKYTKVVQLCYNVLKEDSFSVWVVSDVRSKETTEYYGLVADTIKIHQATGFKFYNEIILYNDTGNLAITSGDYLNKARKVGRQHQNILVFFKGDPKHIKERFGNVYDEEND